MLALENEEQFTLGLVLIGNAKLNDFVCNGAISKGKFIYIPLFLNIGCSCEDEKKIEGNYLRSCNVI